MGYRTLEAYKKAYELAFDIFSVTKEFPKDEVYSLTSQIRRSSRSVCANIAEGYRRRKYRDYFISKLTDCDAENSETGVWIDFSKDCNYININTHQRWLQLHTETGRLLNYMIENPDKFR